MAPKIGPRGVTIDDVQDVATNGIRQTVTTPYRSARFEPAQPAYNPELLAALMAGQPQPSYGEKYGGFPTREMLNDAAMGYALNIRDIGDYALSQGRQLEAPLYAKNQDVQQSATGYDAFAAEIAKGRAKYNTPSSYVADFAKQRQTAEAERQAAVAKYRSDADNEYNTSYDAQVLPYQQISDTIRNTPISQLARQALTTQYGVDPNVARATFTEQTDLDYAKLLRDSELAAQGIDFSMSEGEMIYNSEGREAYRVYQEQKTYEAMNGTPAEQAKAQQDLIDSQYAPVDAEILDEWGITPKEVTGADAETVRALFLDPEFLSKWIRPSIELLDASNGVTSGADIAGQQAQAYLKQNSNDYLRARTLEAIIAEFDFLSR